MPVQSSERRPRRFDREVDGIVLLDKPQGLSSNAALQEARGIFRALKAGHAGSLDPMATGMLPVCFGEATKVCGFLLDSRKTYRFTARLGVRTDTGDADGKFIEEAPLPTLDLAQINAVLAAFMGEQTQIPPMYSALKHQGERLYAMARRGEVVDRPARNITIEQLTLLSYTPTELDIEVRCSKGTYVRTLAEDIAVRLGTVAHLTALRRLQVDPFAAQPMYTLDELAAKAVIGWDALDLTLLPVDRALEHLPAVELAKIDAAALRHGQSAPYAGKLPTGSVLRLYAGSSGASPTSTSTFLGIGELHGGVIRPKRLLAFKPADSAT
jgi:tRNA pseudouridine55 synthase